MGVLKGIGIFVGVFWLSAVCIGLMSIYIHITGAALLLVPLIPLALAIWVTVSVMRPVEGKASESH